MTGISTYGQALSQIRLLSEQNLRFSELAFQLSSQNKTNKFSGLNTDVLTSQRARTSIQSLDTYANNIDHADRRIKAMLTSIEEFKAQAENFSNALTGLTQEGIHQQGDEILYDDPLTAAIETTKIGATSAEPDVDLQTLKDIANNLYPFMIDLLNTKDGDRFLLGGADTNTQPIADNGTLDAQINNLLGNWKDESLPASQNLTSDELISALRSRTAEEDANAVTDSIVGYSAALSANNVNNVYVRISETSEIEYTALADDQAFRDIIVAMSVVRNEGFGPIADVYAEPYTAGDPTLVDGAPGDNLEEMKENFYKVYNDLSNLVSVAIDEIDKVRFKLEGVRARLDGLQQNQEEERNALLNTISNVEQVDTNEVALKIQTLQVQLESSYRVTALMGELSLTKFI
jgi:flagellin-like hook-associated protein FlgL